MNLEVDEMKTLMLYYSRTGTTAKVARTLGLALDAQIAEIKCSHYRSNWLGYLIAGYDSVKGNLPPIEVPDLSWKNYDLVILGAPIWTSYAALPLRSFLSQKPDLPKRVALFLTHGSHSPAQKAVDFVSSLLPIPLEGVLDLPQSQITKDQFSDQIDGFVEKLTTPTVVT
ncbi:hypothetical protein [Lentilitoribacter sp. Alg239-R112]|uniref:flavodoxin family protein n=1 Tax=Lentilitoribacter sp. Alg239-R112 TaxID=2305987 RepID=UPI0013A701DD|nr:hypothetical protein [Lentilitoribacter sp. Alg239-R112]